jgi:hypothetical protein
MRVVCCSSSRKDSKDTSDFTSMSSFKEEVDYTMYNGFSIGDMITVRSNVNEYNLSIIKLYKSCIMFKEINTHLVYYITYDNLDTSHKIFIYPEPKIGFTYFGVGA